MRILLVHPGHGHSTTSVFHGICAGLEMNGVEVVCFDWGRMLQPFTMLTICAEESGKLKAGGAEHLHRFLCYLAGADALAVAAEQEVEAILVVNGLLFPPSRAGLIKKIGAPIACYGTESPYFEKTEREIAPFYSHWFTQERTAVKRFSDLDVPVTYLPMAYNPRIHTPGPIDLDKQCDLVFVGGGFPERKALLEGVDWTGIDRAIHGTLWGLDLDQEQGRLDFGRGTRYTEGAIPNELTTAWHRSSKIALNLHRTMTYIEQNTPFPAGHAESLGPRAYEIPASGGFLLSDDERPEIHEVFGDAAATFNAWDSADLERQIRWWLKHERYREEWAYAQHQAVEPHHWGNRAKTILECLL